MILNLLISIFLREYYLICYYGLNIYTNEILSIRCINNTYIFFKSYNTSSFVSFDTSEGIKPVSCLLKSILL